MASLNLMMVDIQYVSLPVLENNTFKILHYSLKVNNMYFVTFSYLSWAYIFFFF